MRWITKSLLISCLVTCVAFVGCSSRTDKTDSGGVLLSITDFDGLPIAVSVNSASAAGFVQVDSIDIENIAKIVDGNTSDLMNVEIQSYEVKYSRADSGTRIPTPYVRGLFGVVPVGGSITYDNLPVMSNDQLMNLPLSDLLAQNGGTDKETGNSRIVLNFSIRFFGRTLSGNAVETAPGLFTVEFIP
jgi:hypothetical protein